MEERRRGEKVEERERRNGRCLTTGKLNEITRNRKLSDVPILLERPSATQKWCPWAELVAHNVDVHDDVRDDIPPRREGIPPRGIRKRARCALIIHIRVRVYAPRDRRCHDVVPMSPSST